MFPFAILRIARSVASMGIVYAILPNGDVERSLFKETPNGVEATIEHVSVKTGIKSMERRDLPRGRYGWKIEEERRSVILAPPGTPTGVVRRAFVLTAWIDATPNPNVEPHPVEAFQFYASSRQDAEALRERLKKALGKKR